METVGDIPEYEREPHRRTGEKPMPTLNYALLQKNLLVSLDSRYRSTHTILSELNLTMPGQPDTVPDIAIYPKLQIDSLHDVTSMTQMPLTVVDILGSSPQGAGRSPDEIIAKLERYFAAGVKSCWLVMSSLRAIIVFTTIDQYQFFHESSALTDPATGISLSLADVFTV